MPNAIAVTPGHTECRKLISFKIGPCHQIRVADTATTCCGWPAAEIKCADPLERARFQQIVTPALSYCRRRLCEDSKSSRITLGIVNLVPLVTLTALTTVE